MSIHFNPFDYLRNESDIMSLAGILMKATTPEDDNGSNDQFFEQSAEVLLTSILYYMRYVVKKEDRNWKKFVELLDSTTVYTKPNGAIDNRADGIFDRMRKAQVDWKAENDCDFPGYVAVEKYYNGAAETTSSIVASLDAHCRYMKLACVQELLSEDEIRISESFCYSKKTPYAPSGKRILYIVTSEDKRYYDWITSMVYSQVFDELYHLTAMDPSLHEQLNFHLTFLMDEFSNVTLPDSFVMKLSTMRSRNMSAIMIVQNLIQLKRKFPKFDMDKDLIGQCAVIDILGAPDMDSCEYLSKHFGTQTINKASDSDAKDHKGNSSRSEDVMEKPLFSAEDIFAMKKDGECAIVIKGTDPLYEMKVQMEHTPFVKLLCRKANPYDPKITNELRRKRRKAEGSGKFLYSGEKAKAMKRELEADGVQILRFTESDVDLLFKAMQTGTKVESKGLTEETKKLIEANYEAYERERIEKAAFDYSSLKAPEGKEDTEKNNYNKRLLTARMLSQKGFSDGMLRAVYPLLMGGYDAETILSLFSKDQSIEEVTTFVSALKESEGGKS